ncbi:unnamed protein product [Urochloa decumbens]|uniref:Uncharacterized protein n=1 Tax=Urochloa decumbens TaxID=240449 RepID=A0ABC8VE56_9POAL
MPALIPRLLGAGVCFGLLDPVSNIIANTVSSPSCDALPEPNAPAQGEEEEDNRSRKGTVDAATVEEDKKIGKARKRKVLTVEEEGKRKKDKKSMAAAAAAEEEEEEQRQRDEILSKITTDASSIAYLPPRFGRGSLSESRTAAQRSLEGPVTFLICYFRHLPVSEALRYLLLAKADLLAAVHLIEYSRGMGARLFPISSSTMEIALRCAAMSASHPEPVIFAARLLSKASRLEQLEQILTIEKHQLSLDALRQLHELLEEPLKVSPDSPKPLRQAFEMDMICTDSLVRIECRSLNGLLAFLLHLFPTLSEHDALMYLFHSNANLEEVIFRAMCDHDISSSYKDAYKAAADAAWHPHPEAQAEFAVSTRPTLLPIAESSQVISRTLTSSEVELISRYFSQKSYTAKSVPSVPKLVPGADKIVKRNQQKFMATQYFIRRKVKAALKRYAKEKGTEYELHVICGTNCDIPENGRHGYFLNRKGFPYAHVNFLARPKGSQSDNTAPSLFFLECSNGEDLNTLFLCCTELESPTDSGRCFHCEYKGKKIVHPAVGTYRGRETDFEELSCGKRKIDNEGLIIAEKMSIEFVGLSSEEDGLYFDPSMDYDFAVGLNNLVMEEEEARKELLGDNLPPTDMPIEPELLAETMQDVLQDCHRHLILQC